MDDFVSVTHKKPRNRKGKSTYRERTLEEKLLARKVLLQDSGFLQAVLELLQKAINEIDPVAGLQICCLGLGSISESTKSLDQLILLQSIISHLKIPTDQTIECYDPASTDIDNQFLSSINLHPLSNPYDLRLKSTTLLYMPHSPKFLYDDLLRLNWSKEGFSKIIMIGNTLSWYSDPTKPNVATTQPSIYIDRAAPLFQAIQLPLKKDHLDVFNDTSLQWIPSATLDAQPEEFWNFARDIERMSDENKEDVLAVGEVQSTEIGDLLEKLEI